jgi:3-hydroxybutyryl-CoA dehydrogenase
MDLVGVDVGYELAMSFTELSFGEPRWKPSPIQARMVAAGRLGRKAGRGYYEYPEGAGHRPDDPDPLEPGGGGGRPLKVVGDGPLALGLRDRARGAKFDLSEGGLPYAVVDARVRAGEPLDAGGAPLIVLCADRSLAAHRQEGAVGFHLLPPVEDTRLAELTRSPSTSDADAQAAEALFTWLGLRTEWVGDAPGLVLGRIVCQLVNEAAFAIGEGVGSADDVDAGLTLGLNHPRGAVAWGEAIGLDYVLAVIDGLWSERHEERYRAAPLLRAGAGLRG